MPKPNKQGRSMDVNEIAHQLVERSTREQSSQKTLANQLREMKEAPKGEPIPNPTGLSAYMAAIGSKGGKIGGKRRLKTMTAAERKKSAQKAAKARWKKQ